MAGKIKKTIKETRDKVLHGVNESISQLDKDLNHKLDALREDIQYTHIVNQAEVLKQLNMIKNSGTLRISDKEIVTKIFSGLKMYLDPNDIAVGMHIALDGSWEFLITRAWLTVLKPNDTVLDIGANFGYFGALAAQNTDKKKAKVVFFEANPHLIPYINKTLSANWLHEQSKVENLAISDKEGQATLSILKDYIGSSSLHSMEHLDHYMHNKMELKTQEEVLVQAVTIDAYCKNNNIKAVDLIKMDIEGFEEKAYQGMRKTVQVSPNATLFIEFTKDSYEKPEEFYQQLLNDFGNVYVIDGEGLIKKPKKSDYKSVIGDIDDWTMPIFSKRDNLATNEVNKNG